MNHFVRLGRVRRAAVAAAAVLLTTACTERAPRTGGDPPPANGKLLELPMPLDDLLKDPAAFRTYIAEAKAAAGLVNARTRKIKSDDPTKCGSGHKRARIQMTTYETAGDYSYLALTNSASLGYAIADVANENECEPFDIKLRAATPAPPGRPIPSLAIWFIARNAQGAFESRLIDTLSLTDVVGAPRSFVSCDSTGQGHNPGKFGSVSVAKAVKNVCDHVDPPLSLTDTDPAATEIDSDTAAATHDEIDDPWTIWIACDVDCCYARPDTSMTRVGMMKRDTARRYLARKN